MKKIENLKKNLKKNMKNKILMEFPLKLQMRIYCGLFQISDHVPFVDTLA